MGIALAVSDFIMFVYGIVIYQLTKGEVFPQIVESLFEGKYQKIIDEQSLPLLVAMITAVTVVIYQMLNTFISLGEGLFVAWFFWILKIRGYQTIEEFE